jgi:hypothetical protein
MCCFLECVDDVDKNGFDLDVREDIVVLLLLLLDTGKRFKDAGCCFGEEVEVDP